MHEMSFLQNTTRALFQSFMPRRNEIVNKKLDSIYCIQNYPHDFFKNFNPSAPFEKWAAIEVTDTHDVPASMESLVIPEGLYAVFLFKGKASEAKGFFQNIFTSWLPSSEFELDHRPHFEILGAKYINDSPDSEEEVWIPIKLK